MVDSAVKYYKRGSGNNPATLAHYSTLPRKWIIGLYGLRGLLTAFRQAHADSVAWWYQPHVKVIEAPLAILDAIRVKRHFFGYLLALSTVYLLCTPSAPLVANLICLVYPIASSLRVIRGQSGNAHRLLLYWLFFAWMSLFDYYAHTSNIFCFARIFVFLIQYILPVSQGFRQSQFTRRVVFRLSKEPQFTRRVVFRLSKEPQFTRRVVFRLSKEPQFTRRVVFRFSKEPQFTRRVVFRLSKEPQFTRRVVFRLAKEPQFTRRVVFRLSKEPQFTRRVVFRLSKEPQFTRHVVFHGCIFKIASVAVCFMSIAAL